MPNIALVLSGAVSLGSWEAGVVDELLYQLDRLNRDRSPADQFKIDVITGASAGAMTGALVGRAVMVGIEDRQFLRNAWVDDIDISRLLGGVPVNALLSKRPIDEIARRYIATPEVASPSSMAPPRLLMRFTVTNMSGVDYELQGNPRPGATHANFVSTFHAERREFAIHDGNRLDTDTWDAIRDAAIASGNFPFAFAPHELSSAEEQWPDHALSPFPAVFTYIDGGLFNNEPLGDAVALARKLDGSGGHAGLDPSRVFLLVDANLNGTTRDEEFSANSTLPETVFRTLAVLLGESSALDWLKARRVNNEIGWRDDFLRVLAKLVMTTDVDDPGSFQTTLELAADGIVNKKREIFPDRYDDGYRQRGVDRTMARYASFTEGMGDDRARIFGTLAFLLNSVSGLDNKEHLNLHVIYTTPDQTAGDRMRSFAGFFSHEWRLHDYRVGRRTANEELKWILEREPGTYEHEPNIVYDPPDLGDVNMGNAPRPPREMLRDATLKKVDALAKDLDLGPKWIRWATGPLARWGLKKAVKSKLNAVLEL